MTNSVHCQTQQTPSYSGVTINITNPAMTVPPQYMPYREGAVYATPQPLSQRSLQYINKGEYLEPVSGYYNTNVYQNESTENQQIPQTYPQQYYINNYNAQDSEQGISNRMPNSQHNGALAQQNSEISDIPYGQPQIMIYNPDEQSAQNATKQVITNDNAIQSNTITGGIIDDTNELAQAGPNGTTQAGPNGTAQAGPNGTAQAGPNRTAQAGPNELAQAEADENIDTSTSKEIIEELDLRNAQEKELEKNGKKTKVIALTNEYIMSLENYLNNPNTDIRLMAAKEVLTRLDEDKSRYDDAALNALLNKMLQDPSKLVRIAAMSALSSELASGNEYTVQLLNQIQQNPEGDPDDVLEASQILLKRAATTEIKYTPVQMQQNQPTQEAEE